MMNRNKMDQLIKNRASARVNTSLLPTNRSDATNQSMRSACNEQQNVQEKKGISKFPSLESVKIKQNCVKDLHNQNIFARIEGHQPIIYSNGQKAKIYSSRYRKAKMKIVGN